ncbi:hypothetical protein PG993_008931 [Apiospora rasikravindrae]|uniref:C2H2-type domain-containing protein n=1 Tax=Apiospora rasikravindrae TaxID=990691 RepID=A0ABR1SPR1_9PEZI
MRGHELLYKCRLCDKRFSRSDTVPRHMHLKHSQNISAHVCYFEGCTRLRFGYKDEATLIQHLQQIHDGATMVDNERAKTEQGFDQVDNPVSGAAETGQESSSDVEDDSECSQEESNYDYEAASVASVDPGPAHRDNGLAEKETLIEQLQEQLQEERDGHLMEIADIHKSYKTRLERLRARIIDGTLEEAVEELDEFSLSIPA